MMQFFLPLLQWRLNNQVGMCACLSFLMQILWTMTICAWRQAIYYSQKYLSWANEYYGRNVNRKSITRELEHKYMLITHTNASCIVLHHAVGFDFSALLIRCLLLHTQTRLRASLLLCSHFLLAFTAERSTFLVLLAEIALYLFNFTFFRNLFIKSIVKL